MNFLRLSILSLFAATCLLFQSGCDKRSQDREIVKVVFGKTFDALADHDGAAYADLLANESVNYYATVHKMALTGKKADLLALPIQQRYEVLLVRLLGKKSELKDLDGKGMAEWEIKSGLWDYIPEPDGELDLGAITFVQNEAYGKITERVERKRRARYFGTYTAVRHQSTPYAVRFILENGQWKYVCTEYNRAIGSAIQDMLDDQKGDPNLALARLLNEVTEKEVPPSIWDKMLH